MRQLLEVFNCDRCKREAQCSSFSIDDGSCVDASGNNARRTIDFDLCPPCQILILNSLFDKLRQNLDIQNLLVGLKIKFQTSES